MIIINIKFLRQIKNLQLIFLRFSIMGSNKNKSGNKKSEFSTKVLEKSKKIIEITSEDIEGWLVANDGALTVALDVNISEPSNLSSK